MCQYVCQKDQRRSATQQEKSTTAIAHVITGIKSLKCTAKEHGEERNEQ